MRSPTTRQASVAHAAKRYSHTAALRRIAVAAATRPSTMFHEDSNCHPALPDAFEPDANLP